MKKTKLILRIVSAVAFAGAIPLIVVAGINMGNFDNKLNLLMIPGMFLFAIAIMLLALSFFIENFKRVKEMQAQAMASMQKFTESSDKVCPKCGEKNDTDADFCQKCGEKLNTVCPVCGTANDADAVFCKKCGNKIK